MPLRTPIDVKLDRCAIRVIHADRVAKAHNEAISDGEIDRLASVYKLLGDPTRLKIVMALKSGEMCVCDLAAFIDISESAVSHQLRRLKDMSLVRKRRAGQILYYTLDDEHVTALLETGLAHIRE